MQLGGGKGVRCGDFIDWLQLPKIVCCLSSVAAMMENGTIQGKSFLPTELFLLGRLDYSFAHKVGLIKREREIFGRILCKQNKKMGVWSKGEDI